MNVEIIKHLSDIKESLSLLIVALSCEDSDESTKTSTSRGRPAKNTTTTPPADLSEFDDITMEKLDSMTFAAIKKLAKKMGITGEDRDSIVESICEKLDLSPAKETEKAVPSSSKKLGAKKIVAPDPEPEPDEEEDPVLKSALDATEDMSDQEIIEYLTEVGIEVSKKSKRQALIALVVKGIKSGDIDLDDEGDSDEDTSEEDSSDDEEEVIDDTPERKKAILKSNKSIDKEFKDKTLTREELNSWYVESFEGSTMPKTKKMKDEDILNEYKKVSAMFIDDEGETHEESDAYYIHEVPYCCGSPLKLLEDEGVYTCEDCGAEYPID